MKHNEVVYKKGGIDIIFKNKIFLLVLLLTLMSAIIFMINQTRYTTFQELVSDQLNEESTVRGISIAINKNIDEYRTETVARANIEDELLINDILEDFAEIELKKDEDAGFVGKRYTVEILVNNEVRENHSRTTTLRIEVDSNYLYDYKIISNTNHLKTIESVIENGEVDWDYIDN